MYGKGMSILLKKIYKLSGNKKPKSEEDEEVVDNAEEEAGESDEVGSFPPTIAKLSEKNVKIESPQFDDTGKEDKKKKSMKGMAVVGFQSKKMRKMKA
jgi:hypothetical protein